MYNRHESLIGMLKPMMMFTGTWRLDSIKSTVQLLYWLYSLIFQGFGLLFVVLVRSGDLVFCTCFLLMQIAQVLVLGLFANDIIVQSRATAADLYNMNWHYLDTKNRKMFLMMLMQYQHVSVISIGPFGPMTVESVISVGSLKYNSDTSIFTILESDIPYLAPL
ncbi:hypothetical protein HUJ05_005250 [Dendroctonus ponderosae]|nr:hypothetical protein HUJ05_005250 [Dendroctonus ponderosae]